MISGASIDRVYTHSIDDLLPHAPLHYGATGEMVKGSLEKYFSIHIYINTERRSPQSLRYETISIYL